MSRVMRKVKDEDTKESLSWRGIPKYKILGQENIYSIYYSKSKEANMEEVNNQRRRFGARNQGTEVVQSPSCRSFVHAIWNCWSCVSR